MSPNDDDDDQGVQSFTNGAAVHYASWDMGLPSSDKIEAKLLEYFKYDDIGNKDRHSDEERLRNGVFRRGEKEVEIIHRISLRRSANCFVSHVDSPSCIWVKLANNITDQLNKPVPSKHETFLKNFTPEQCQRFRYCMAPRTEKIMARARILHIQHLKVPKKNSRERMDRTFCYVVYIDYGNTQWVCSKALLPLDENLYYHPWQAIPVALFPLVHFQDIVTQESTSTWSDELCDLTREVLSEFPKLHLKILPGSHTYFNTYKVHFDSHETISPIICNVHGINDDYPEGISVADLMVARSGGQVFCPAEFLDPNEFLTRCRVLSSDRINREISENPNYLEESLERGNIPDFFCDFPDIPNEDWADEGPKNFGGRINPLSVEYLEAHSYNVDDDELVLKICPDQRRCGVPFFRASVVKPLGEERNKASVIAQYFNHYKGAVTSFDEFSHSLQIFYGNPTNQLPLNIDHVNIAELKTPGRETYGIFKCMTYENEQVPLQQRYRRIKIIEMEELQKRGETRHEQNSESTYTLEIEYVDFGLKDRILSSTQSLLEIHRSHCMQPPFVNAMRICFEEDDFFVRKDPNHKEKFAKALKRDKLYVGKLHSHKRCPFNKSGNVLHITNLRVLDEDESEPFVEIFKRRLQERDIEPRVAPGVKVRSWHKVPKWQLLDPNTDFEEAAV
ncbi:hypothetical protein QR680_008058 [Steinernema hermaphroditum]|uniref:Tudor domain-containing protein n=1 Tax=Steinernema hermaphroditum TaxID=289476 RepID=A0AA39M6Z5_9BILA|nr:hypothetical protein QR680_008058 [Steinernema hermaphroditum]